MNGKDLNIEEYKDCVISFLFPMFYDVFGEKMRYLGISINSLSGDIEDEKLVSFTFVDYYENNEDPQVTAEKLYDELYPMYNATGQVM